MTGCGANGMFECEAALEAEAVLAMKREGIRP
jgi:hypothetical protein